MTPLQTLPWQWEVIITLAIIDVLLIILLIIKNKTEVKENV
jgi:uncharacterized integral membrane protein